MSWVPTNEFLRGKIIKPFLPFQKHPTLTNENFKNLYPGDDVYIFETKNEKWARGYTLTKPFPNDFTITSVNLDELPSLDIKIVIFPLKYVQVVENVPITKLEAEEVSVVAGNGELVPTIQDAEVAHKQALNADIGYDSNGKVKSLVPPLPVQNFDLGADLLKEIKHALNLLASHIFALYSIGEFRLFNKLSSVYTRLDETRIKLTNEILTTNEIQVAKETATFLLNKIPKKLASRSARLNEKSYDLDNRYTDISGYKAILARDAISGQLLSNDTAIPSRVALNQVLCALAPNFPINAHYHQESFSLKPSPNKKLYHEPPSHILVDFKSVSGSSAYQPPGFVGMIAYLYIRNSNRRLTEAFAVHASSVDDLVHVEKLRAALFRNIPSSEIDNGKVYLVAVLTEEIELPVKDASSPHVRRIKKGVAAGVTDITRIFSKNQGSLASGEPHQFSIRLFGSYKNQNKGNSKLNDELLNFDNNGWGELVDRIISGSSHGVAVNPRAEKLVISVKEFKHQFVANFNPIGATAPISRIKPIFFDPLAENYERIYLSMHKVSLLNSITKDDLLTFEVSAPNNDMITFAKASNEQERRMWQYVSVYPDEAVGEIVKINGVSSKNPTKKVPKDDYIILSLYINGLLAGEGKFMYKSGNKLVEYKKKSHSVEISSTTHKLPVASVEITTEYVGKVYNHDISIDNVFQFDRFFKGGQQGIDELAKTLIAFTKLDITQLVKFFPELLSSLYNIADVALKQPSSPGIEILQDNTFKAIVHLLDTLFGKQDQYMYMVETFTTRYTKLPHIGIFILNKISEIFSRAESNWNSMSRSLCRVVSLLLKLGISSINEINDLDAYLEALSSLFRSGSIFLSLDSPALINDQVLILEIIDYVLTFRVYLDQAKILKFIISFIDSIGTRGLGANEDVYGAKKNVVSKDHKIIISKLLLIHRLFNTTLVESADTRKFLISKSITWVMDVFLGPTDIDAVRLACSIMNAVCTLLWDDIVNKGVEDEIHLCFSLAKLLPAISRTFIKYNKFTRGNEYFKPKRTFTDLFPTDYPFKETSMDPIVNDESLVEVLVELSVIFTFIARIGKAASGNEGYSKILAAEAPEDDFFSNEKYLASNFGNEDILTLINGVKIIRQGKYFPEDKWLSLFSLIAEGCLVSLELIRPLLIKHYVPPMEDAELFDKAVWGSYLKTLLRLGTVAPVAIEHLSTVPRKACHLITGDMRDRISFLLMEAWDALAWDSDEEVMVRFNLKKFGGYQVEFISNDYETLQDLMLFALQRNESCQIVSVKMLWSIMVSEFLYLNDTMVDIERECLIGLHDIYYRTAYKPTVQEQKRFIERMKLTIRLDREDEAFGMVYNFIESLTGFLEVLNDLNSVPVGPEFDDDRTFHKLNINAYLKNANKPELFHSFINNMYEENINKGDFIQAALSLELLASTYSWNHHEILSATLKPKFPEQTSFERKETLYNMIATNYIKGNSLERATDTYNELLDSYSEHTYDLKSFAHVHRKLANLYIEMESSDKLSPSFFRVAFIGAGFPTNIRGKEQIYEGLPFEHITSIHERLLRLYPGARIISDDIQAQKLKEKVQTGRYLHVNAVEPINEISDKLFNTSIGVRQYARNKNLRFFTTMKKIPGATSVFDLWTEETTYETQMSFPTLMNRSDIKSVKTIKLSPLDNAIRTIVNKNNDLIQLESMINISFKEKADYTSLFNDLSRQLAGTVDSPVNGGVGQYRTFFNDPKYNGKEDYTYNIRLLKNAFNDLTIILNRCLHLHGKLISNNMKASHDVLVELFKKNFKEDIANLKISTDYENSIYNHSISHYPQSLQLENNSKRNISSNTTLNGGGSMIGGSIGSRLTRTTSRTSKASSNSNSSASGLVSPPSEQNSTTQNSNNSSFTFIGLKQKHSAVYWRDNVMRN